MASPPASSKARADGYRPPPGVVDAGYGEGPLDEHGFQRAKGTMPPAPGPKAPRKRPLPPEPRGEPSRNPSARGPLPPQSEPGASAMRSRGTSTGGFAGESVAGGQAPPGHDKDGEGKYAGEDCHGYAGEHPGFQAVEAKIGEKPGIRDPGAVLAAATRRASPAAKKANPRLNRVKG